MSRWPMPTLVLVDSGIFSCCAAVLLILCPFRKLIISLKLIVTQNLCRYTTHCFKLTFVLLWVKSSIFPIISKTVFVYFYELSCSLVTREVMFIFLLIYKYFLYIIGYVLCHMCYKHFSKFSFAFISFFSWFSKISFLCYFLQCRITPFFIVICTHLFS